MALYEDIPYPGFPFPQTHPDRLALVATLRGLRPAPPEACRVLEIGCADGLNLVGMAAHSPGLQAVGFDAVAGPLARGRELADALGLRNVRLEQMDVLEAGAQLGEFDYVVAHGVYGWAPPEVRDALLRTVKGCLAHNGVAFVSYNAFPGAHVRQMIRAMVFHHAQGARGPRELAAKARELFELMAPWAAERPDAYGQMLEHELERLRALPAHSLVHDDLSAASDAVWLTDFATHAAQHGLQFLAEAEHEELRYDRHPPGFDQVLDAVAGGDPIRWEQYSDFLSGRPFRQTVVCHDGLQVVRPIDTTAPERLLSTLGPAAHAEHVDVRAGNGGGPPRVLERAIDALKEAWPRPLAFDELVDTARPDPRGALGPALAGGFRRGLVDFHAAPLRHTTEPPERPATSALIRLLAEQGPDLVTLRHENVRLEDPFGRLMLRLLDGTRDREQLLEDLVAGVEAATPVKQDFETVTEGERLREQIAAGLEHNLRSLASLGLLQA
jgi:methyltransferase-like protein